MFENLRFYKAKNNLKAAGVQVPFTEENVKEYIKCAKDPIYFIENYAKIVSLDEGVVPFKLFGYQKNIINAAHNNRNTIALCPRQYGKSTVIAGYFAWYVLFNDNKTAVILANKQAIAIEIFSRVQFIIENIPQWLQQGVVEWNKKSFALENGSKVVAAASSPSAVRGMSVNLLLCVDGKSKITIHNKKTGEIKSLNIEELEQLDDIAEHKWEVLTDTGWSDFDGLKITESNRQILIQLEQSILKCSLDHRVMTSNGWIESQKLTIGNLVETFNGYQKVVSVKLIEKTEKLYDLVGVKNGSRYYTNSILSHNCDEFAHLGPNLADDFIASVFPTLSSSEQSKLIIISTPNGLNHYHKLWIEAENNVNGFTPVKVNWYDHPKRSQEWADDQRRKLGDVRYRQEVEVEFQGSSYTLIDGSKLAKIPIETPIFQNDNLEIFEAPDKEKSYVITVDVSRGRHRDFSAFSIIDVSQMPYKIVGTYKDNTISTLEYPHLIYNTARQYNNAFILIEINDLGEEVSNIIWNEYEYENMYFTQGDKLTQGRGYPGIRTTTKVKGLGCSVLKELVEKDQLFIRSHKIIEELGIFVLNKKSYAAEDPAINDDLCTTLWLFAWLTKQDIFQEVTNINLRGTLIEQKQDYINKQLTPFGFYNDGRREEEDNSKIPSTGTFLTRDQIELLSM